MAQTDRNNSTTSEIKSATAALETEWTADPDNTERTAGTNRTEHRRKICNQKPAFLHTAGPAQAINMDDIIELTVGTFRCPADLQNKVKNVVTYLDRVVWTTEKHKVLRETLQTDSSSQELKKQIGDYFCAFGRRNERGHGDETNDAAAVATILAVAGPSPACKILVEKAMLYGVGLGLSQLQQAAADVETGTQLGAGPHSKHGGPRTMHGTAGAHHCSSLSR